MRRVTLPASCGEMLLLLTAVTTLVTVSGREPCSLTDAYGCCIPDYFYCGSNGRCTHSMAECEDGGDMAPPPCRQKTSPGVEYDLERLRLVKGGETYWSNKISFNVCANAARPSNCANATPSVAWSECERLGGSAYTSKPVFKQLQDPSEGVRVTYVGGAEPITFEILCDPKAVDSPVVQPRSNDTSIVVLRSASGCPLGCARNEMGTVCSGRGDCVYAPSRGRGAHCECDRSFGGSACDSSESSSSRSNDSTILWRGVAAFLAIFAGLLVVARRCHSLRRARMAAESAEDEVDDDTLRRRLRYRSVATDNVGGNHHEGLELHRPLTALTLA